jgi:hypothetical protein
MDAARGMSGTVIVAFLANRHFVLLPIEAAFRAASLLMVCFVTAAPSRRRLFTDTW